ncbi:hypothetical protein X801_04698, partial [Opisthorchis viverrini]
RPLDEQGNPPSKDHDCKLSPSEVDSHIARDERKKQHSWIREKPQQDGEASLSAEAKRVRVHELIKVGNRDKCEHSTLFACLNSSRTGNSKQDSDWTTATARQTFRVDEHHVTSHSNSKSITQFDRVIDRYSTLGKTITTCGSMEDTMVCETIHPSDPGFVPDIERHTRFIETQAGALVCHDYERQQYFRNYQSEVDLDIIRRFVGRNFCSEYPNVTVRYFAQNWPELCIIAFTDTHIPIGLIIGQQTEPHIGRIAFFAVEKRVEAHLVLLKPLSEQTKNKLLRYIGNQPLRYMNPDKEFQFYI